MSEVEWWDFDSAEALAEQAADDIAFVVESAIEARGDAVIALTPGPIGLRIAARLAASSAKLASLTVVAANGDGSDFARLAGGGATIVAPGSPALADLRAPFDLAALEVGEGGSIAGIGPGPEAEPALSGPRGRRAVTLPSGATLTKAAFEGVRALMIVGSGADLRAILERAILDGPLSRAPVGRILADAETDADILWAEA